MSDTLFILMVLVIFGGILWLASVIANDLRAKYRRFKDDQGK